MLVLLGTIGVVQATALSSVFVAEKRPWLTLASGLFWLGWPRSEMPHRGSICLNIESELNLNQTSLHQKHTPSFTSSQVHQLNVHHACEENEKMESFLMRRSLYRNRIFSILNMDINDCFLFVPHSSFSSPDIQIYSFKS